MEERTSCDKDINYKTMYLTMVRASEKAIQLLIEAQQKCEAMYIDGSTVGAVREFFGDAGAELWMRDEREEQDAQENGLR